MKKMMTMVMTLCVTVMLIAGCYGPFKLTRKVYEWNGSLENQWGREALFLVMAVLPVYSISMFADAVFFNLVEFWGGDNPIASAPGRSTRIVSSGDREAVFSFNNEARRLRVDLFDHYRPQGFFIVEQTADGSTAARDENGEILMSASTGRDGEVKVTDAEGRAIALQMPGEMK